MTGSPVFSFAAVRRSLAEGADPVALALESHRRAAASSGLFTALVPVERVRRRAEALAETARGRASLPLLGLTFCVKDNIHVAGMATTANCPALAVLPEESAPVVAALEAAGAVLVGKNTMDQFATGLNGTRGPEPACCNALDPALIPGGSSSGSAVAVARDIVSFALGSDTGGSGRVPAACNGLVGVKPTVGLVSSRGLLYANRLFDCVPVFARTCAEANAVLRLVAGYDARDPFSRRDADAIATEPALPASRVLAVPRRDQLSFCGDAAAEAAFFANCAVLEVLGFRFTELDFAPFAEAGGLVFGSALVAERLIDFGAVLAAHSGSVHPAVRAAIAPGLDYTARDAFAALYRMRALQRITQDALAGFAALVTPTVPTIFTVEAMLAEPMARNAALGTYTAFVNPMDLCAVSVPGVPMSGGLPSALQVVGLAGTDAGIAALASAFERAVRGREPVAVPPVLPL